MAFFPKTLNSRPAEVNLTEYQNDPFGRCKGTEFEFQKSEHTAGRSERAS